MAYLLRSYPAKPLSFSPRTQVFDQDPASTGSNLYTRLETLVPHLLSLLKASVLTIVVYEQD